MKRYNIDAPASSQYEEAPDGEWVRYEDAQAEACVTCALDVPLSKAHTMSIWAELQLRADNPCKRTEAERRVLDALADVSPATLKFWRATRHIDGFGAATEFIDAAVLLRDSPK